MQDYEYLFATNLHQKLKEKIIGKNFVGVRDDRLYIKIESIGGLVFEMTYSDFSNKLLHGLSSDYIVYEIVEKFKKFVLNKYFIRETDLGAF